MLKSIGIILLLIALVVLIDLLIEGSGPRGDGVSIVGAESDSAGGRYIRMSNGEVYHRRAQDGLNRQGAQNGRSGTTSTYNASSFDD